MWSKNKPLNKTDQSLLACGDISKKFIIRSKLVYIVLCTVQKFLFKRKSFYLYNNLQRWLYVYYSQVSYEL